MAKNKSRSNFVVGIVLVTLGVLFLLGNVINVWRYLWPFFIIGVGAAFFAGMLSGGKSTSGLAIPGSIISTVGLLLLVMNIFGNWEAWAYAWTLILVSVGVGIFIHGSYGDAPEARRAGRTIASIGVILFLVFGAIFEISFGLFGVRRGGGLLWPLALIAVGIYLLVERSGWLDRRRKKATPAVATPEPAAAPEASEIIEAVAEDIPEPEGVPDEDASDDENDEPAEES